MVNATVFAGTRSTVNGRSEFIVLDPAFGKTLEREINDADFRTKLAKWMHLSFAAVRKEPAAKLIYSSDHSELSNLAVNMAFLNDPSGKLSETHLGQMNDKLNEYIILRLQGKNPSLMLRPPSSEDG